MFQLAIIIRLLALRDSLLPVLTEEILYSARSIGKAKLMEHWLQTLYSIFSFW